MTVGEKLRMGNVQERLQILLQLTVFDALVGDDGRVPQFTDLVDILFQRGQIRLSNKNILIRPGTQCLSISSPNKAAVFAALYGTFILFVLYEGAQIDAVRQISKFFGVFQEQLLVNPAVEKSDFFGRTDNHTLAHFDHFYEI